MESLTAYVGVLQSCRISMVHVSEPMHLLHTSNSSAPGDTLANFGNLAQPRNETTLFLCKIDSMLKTLSPSALILQVSRAPAIVHAEATAPDKQYPMVAACSRCLPVGLCTASLHSKWPYTTHTASNAQTSRRNLSTTTYSMQRSALPKHEARA